MDQEAFRNLISTSSALAGPSGSTGNRSFGKAHKRSAPPTSFTRPSDLKPRKLKRDSTYTDRASARRSGTTNEFDDVEELHRDFEERIAAAETEEERQRLRDQISSVGGDARYSVLVKGLDWGLLAQNKARVERENGGYEQGGGEGELEVAYQEGRAGDDGEGEGKRSREDIVEAIRRRREAKGALKDEPKTGFRPIGFKPIGGPDKQEEGLAEYKWVGGKRMRKKKKLEAAPVEEELASKEAEQVKAVQGAKMDPIRRDASEPKPKKSKWDDDEPSAKKKKKKRH
uniref:RED-like N-terminal domain-containing protein n=1 Tax=Kalmanozyma brasiliensis (strain GHG001) TaxID=1365824 RepID=V5E5L9_KALBG